jgi:flagellar assembly protein FliH
MAATETLALLRCWAPPSFDPPPPPPPPPPSLSQADIDATLEAARLQGHALGRDQGMAQGLAQGLEQGLAEGRAEGRRLAFEAARDRLSALTSALQDTLAEISGLPGAIAEPVIDLALLVAQRLTGSQAFERAAFVAAVQEALMHLPMPGEQLLLRLAPADERDWQEALGRFDLPCGHAVVVDPDLPPGRVFVEVGGTRLDIGPAARQALVRSALGLPLLLP